MNIGQLQKLIFILPALSLATSILYQWGYWRQFNVNILEFIDLTDALKRSIYPLLALTAVLVFSRIIQTGLNILDEATDKPKEKEPLIIRAFEVGSTITAILITIAILGLALTSTYIKYLSAAFLISIFASHQLSENETLKKTIKSKHVLRLASYAVTFTVLGAYGLGELNANEAMQNKNYLIINGATTNYTYLGMAGGYIFMWNQETKKVVQMKEGLVSTLEFNAFENEPFLDFSSDDDG